MTWTDHFGLDNTLDSLKGEITVYEGKLESSQVEYSNVLQHSGTIIKLGTNESFNKCINKIYYKPTVLYVPDFVDANFELNVGVTA